MRNFIVVPDGLDRASSEKSVSVSWAYQCVLDHVLRTAQPEDFVFLAPANKFGQGESEHEAAAKYLKTKNPQLRIGYPERIDFFRYLDTRHNAVLLREFLIEKNQWPLPKAELVSYAPHAVRARMIFEQEGYRFSSPTLRAERTLPMRPIVRRLWYYNFPLLHRAYETLAFGLFFFRWK